MPDEPSDQTRKRRRKRHPATSKRPQRRRFWEFIGPEEAPLLRLNKKLQVFWGNEVPTLSLAFRFRPMLLRELHRLLIEETLEPALILRDYARYEVKRQTGMDVEIPLADAMAGVQSRRDKTETAQKWLERLGIPTSESGLQPEHLGPLLEEVAEASVRIFGARGLDLITAKCTMADLTARAEDDALDRGERRKAAQKLEHLLLLAVPLVKPRLADPEILKAEIQRIRTVIAEIKRPSEMRGHDWDRRAAEKYGTAVKSRVRAECQEISPEVLGKVDFTASPTEIAVEVVALSQRPPLKASSLLQLLKKRRARRHHSLAVIAELQST